MLAAVLRDAARQYRHRPATVLATVALQVAALALEPAAPLLQAALAVALVAADLLLELFLIAYLAGALSTPAAPAAEAVAATRRSILPGVRAYLLLAVYLLLALLVGMFLLGGVSGDELNQAQRSAAARTQQTAFVIGVGPLFALALAFLAVLRQRIVLGGERRVLAAAAVSHRVAGRYFPLCLLIGLVQAAGLVVVNLELSRLLVVGAGVAFAVLAPLLIGMSNALYLRTSELHPPVQPQPGNPGRR